MEQDHWFQKKPGLTGGVCGAIIGVSHMDRAVDFYTRTLDYTHVCTTGGEQSQDLHGLPGADRNCRRTILASCSQPRGAFGRLLGSTIIELLDARTATPKIFGGRYWGDLGFIHVCYDVCSMQTHERICERLCHPLTVNSGNSFNMGEAAGQFAYNEDPDGTLIEYVETHKVPILKKTWVVPGFTKSCKNTTIA